MRQSRLIALVFVGILAATVVARAAEDPRLESFRSGLEEYNKIRKQAEGKLPKLPPKATPGQIEAFHRELAAAIRATRAGARPGDVFTPRAAELFREILKQHFSGSQNKDNRIIARQGNPRREHEVNETAQPIVEVNAVYPHGASMSTMPPALLQTLPKLPANIEYRFVGNILILLDAEASNIIIDYLKGGADEL